MKKIFNLKNIGNLVNLILIIIVLFEIYKFIIYKEKIEIYLILSLLSLSILINCVQNNKKLTKK